MGRKPSTVGRWWNDPFARIVTHYSWVASVRETGPEGFTVDARKHRFSVVCRVTKDKKIAVKMDITKDPTKVTCRACLKQMAKIACREELWRARIVKSYLGARRNGPR